MKQRIIEFIKNLVKELIGTFSLEKSYFSSKKLERFAIFANVLIIVNIWCYYHIKVAAITDMIMLISTLLAYGGWNTTQIRKDKLDDNTPPNTP
jgi:hypothetical protein